MGGKSAPKSPDYAAAAAEQAKSSREVTEQQTWANRPDQYTPFGTTTWENTQEWDPSTQQWLNKWTQNTELNPLSQEALDSQLRLTRDRSQMAEGLTGRMQNEFGQAVDWSGIRAGGADVNAPGRVQGGPIQHDISTEGLGELDPSQKYYQNANDAIYGQWADRALPQQARDTDATRARLYNMGLKEGDPAFDSEMQKLQQSQGDAMQQAAYNATIGAGSEAQRMLGMDASTRAQLFGERNTQGQFGNAAQAQDFSQQLQGSGQDFSQQMQASQYQTQQRQQAIAELMQQRGWSLNEINALLNGQQVGMPSMPSFNQAQRSEGLQSLSAAQMQGQADLDRFNAQQQATQGMMSGIGSLAGGAAMMSDRRMKKDIKRVGITTGGTNIYAFRYIFGGPLQFGVMADEVPDATINVNGIDYVDYSKVK